MRFAKLTYRRGSRTGSKYHIKTGLMKAVSVGNPALSSGVSPFASPLHEQLHFTASQAQEVCTAQHWLIRKLIVRLMMDWSS